MKSASFKITGTKPLLMANGNMADPASVGAKAYRRLMAIKPNSRAKKTLQNPALLDKWYEQEKELQALNAHYYDPKIGIYIPAANMVHLVMEAFFGGSTKVGSKILSGTLQVTEEFIKFDFDGPKTPAARVRKECYRSSMTVNHAMGGSRVRVVQAKFDVWCIPEVTFQWHPLLEKENSLGKGKDFDSDILETKLRQYGQLQGLGAYRKAAAYGKFEIVRV